MNSQETLLNEIRLQLTSPKDKSVAIQKVMALIHESRTDYHWVGLYLLEGKELKLGPYVGPVTDHVRIPIGQGVCGTAVATNENQRVDDVRAIGNYLACNLETRSEIVVLIRHPKSGAILGQIDIDSTRVAAFSDQDERFLDEVASLIAPLLPL